MSPNPPAIAAIARIRQWFTKFDPAKVDAEFWSSQLGDLPVTAVVAAVDQRARVQPAFPPEIGEIVVAARALMAPARPSLSDVRLEITNAIRDVGKPPVGCSATYEPPKFSEATAAVVAKLGGWGRVADKPAEGTPAIRNWDFALQRAYTDETTVHSPLIEGGTVPDGLAGEFGLDLRLKGKR